MSDVDKIDLAGLRKRLTMILAEPQEPASERTGSLYLRALACCWLAADNDSAEEQQLQELYTSQAEFEGVEDSDQLLTDIIMAGMP